MDQGTKLHLLVLWRNLLFVTLKRGENVTSFVLYHDIEALFKIQLIRTAHHKELEILYRTTESLAKL